MSRQIKLISWNVNGLRAVMAKGFTESLRSLDADVVALQETKLQEPQLTDEMKSLDDYRSYWSFCTIKKGYSGVATYTRLEPQAVGSGIGIPAYDDEGRVLEMDFGDFVFFNVYFPNGGMGPDRLQYKLDFYRDFFKYADGLRGQGRSLIITGDYCNFSKSCGDF
jgi:exodeoxyribonuclease III